jgi:hypothetical protein
MFQSTNQMGKHDEHQEIPEAHLQHVGLKDVEINWDTCEESVDAIDYLGISWKRCGQIWGHEQFQLLTA